MVVRVTTENAHIVKPIKNILQGHGLLDKAQKITKTNSKFYIPSVASLDMTRGLLAEYLEEIQLEFVGDSVSANNSLSGLVSRYLHQHLTETSHSIIAALIEKLPKKWSLYPPMVLFNTGYFDSELWASVFDSKIDKDDFYAYIVSAFPGNITHFAVNRPIIEEDVMRRPFNLMPLWGDFGPSPTPESFSNPSSADIKAAFWCSAVQNGIHQTWAPRYTMFSRGNIKEKKRVLDNFTNLQDKNVLDLYAGIGYFTLSYLANGATVFCWEINPWSIEGLVRGLQRNAHKYKVFSSGEVLTHEALEGYLAQGIKAFVFHESNEKAPARLAQLGLTEVSHINLGLLPSSKPSWNIACGASQESNETTIHVHENVHKDKFTELREEIATYFTGHVTHLEKVKTFAPDVWHVVVDVVVGQQESGFLDRPREITRA